MSRRLAILAVLLFFLAGLLIVEQRPQHSLEHSHFLNSIHDMILGPVELPRQAQKPLEKPKQETEPKPLDVCTVLNPLKGFIDLRGLSNLGNEGKALPWVARGFDSGHNYTVGICLTPIKRAHLNTQTRDGVNALHVGAFYVDPLNGDYVLLGEYATTPVFSGRKLTMTYVNGSYCDMTYKNGERVRKRSVLTFTCDREMMTKAHISYLTSIDDCTYMFEVRSHYACPTAAKADNLAAIWIFLLIFLAALLVYFSGGFLYRNLKLRNTAR